MKARTEVFLKAAEIMAEKSEDFSCNAVAEASPQHYLRHANPNVAFYAEWVLGGDDGRTPGEHIEGWWLTQPPTANDERVLALCFAAAISETEE